MVSSTRWSYTLPAPSTSSRWICVLKPSRVADSADLDALRRRERIRGGEARLVDEDSLQDEILLVEALAERGHGVVAGEIGHVLHRRAVVPAMLQVLEQHLRADVLHGAVRLDADARPGGR